MKRLPRPTPPVRLGVTLWSVNAALGLLLLGDPTARAADPSPSPVPAVQRPANIELADLVRGMVLRGEVSPQFADHLISAALASPTSPGAPPSAAPAVPCGTIDIMRARAWVQAQGVSVKLKAPPSVGSVSSSLYPVKVFYPSNNTRSKAEEVLVYVENEWAYQVEELGFNPPFTGGEDGPVVPGLWVYLSDDMRETVAGYVEPLAGIDSTPATDCSCRMVVRPRSRGAEGIIAHEFAHTTQMATDCDEAMSAYEMFAVAVVHGEHPTDSYFFSVVGDFQRFPHVAMDHFAGGGAIVYPSALYHYGAGLFPQFLKERYGNQENEYFRELWNSFAQDGTVVVTGGNVFSDVPNEPTSLQGIDALLQESGSSFEEALDEFSVWRAITRADDDGEHFVMGDRYASVTIRETIALDSLPVTDSEVLSQYGSMHFALGVQNGSGEIKVSVSGDPELAWGGSLLLWRAGSPVERVELVFDGVNGETEMVSVDDLTRSTLVVSARTGEPPTSSTQRLGRAFSYTIEGDWKRDSPPPEPFEPPLGDAGVADVVIVETGPQVDAGNPRDASPEEGFSVDERGIVGGGGCACRTGSLGARPNRGATLLGLLERR